MCALLLGPAGFTGTAHAQTVNPDDVTYLLPFWADFPGKTDAEIKAEIAYMRERIGPEGPYFKFGFTAYIFISMEDWNVNTSSPAAIRAALASTIAQIDARLTQARTNSVPISLMFLTKIRERVDPVQTASENEDVRSMQWYADNVVGAGWWTHSKYARKARAVQEAYIRELGKIVANRMRLYPDILVAATGDGEVELLGARTPNIYGDYSPFTVAEFRDWIRHAGIYASGAGYAGKGYANGARYAGDLTPGTDTNGDGHTLNGDFGKTFQSWDLLHFNWSLDDAYQTGDPRAISLATYSALVNRLPGEVAGGFDPPRTPQAVGANAWWDLWVLFKQVMLQHHNTEYAKWMTTSADPETGATIPKQKWFSDQIPADYLFGGTPEKPNERFHSSASSFWTADVSPYGSLGITGFNIDFRSVVTGWIAYTLRNVAPQVAARDVRWGVIEWHPGVLYPVGVSTDLELYRSEMAVVEQYRPTLLQPFTWDTPPNETKGTAFETALGELVTRIRDGSPPAPRLEFDPAGSNGRVTEPFELRGWAVDLGKIRGPGRGPGMDEVHLYAYPNPGSGAPPIFLGVAAYGSARADVAAAHGTQFTNSGFALTVRTLPAGRYQFVAYGRSTVSMSFNAANSITLDVEVTMTASPASLKFGATKAGAAGGLLATTPAQSVTLLYDGPGTPAWTATADQPWLQLANASGTGAGQFSASIVNPSNVIGGATSLTATITVTAANVNATPTLVPITLTVDQSGGGTAPPFGLIDTPLQNVTGVVGSIGVTGWAVDDVGVSSVTLYRKCLSFEPAVNCAIVAGRSVVFMGTADIVPGARPDVEAVYPGYPQAYRAGWGYLLLTNLLPHLPREVMYGGQGTIELHVLATDIEGHQQWLGRTVFDQIPTTVTMANDTATRPFGAIDTPGQGATVTGRLANFGWALTPDTNETAGSGDILVPTNGGTMWVWIDGVPRSTIIYNLCRGSVASPPTASQYCDDDVANIFGNPTPQPLFTLRSANPTKYRNLDAGRGAIGAYFVDTTTLSNGRHSIVWSVTDSAGRVDGIGSRDFIVLNGGSGGASLATPDAAHRDASSLEALPTDVGANIRGRTGWDVWAPLVTVPVDAAGIGYVRLPPLGRLELRLGPVDAGHLVANGTLRDLPPGSHLDAARGLFTWAPSLGYFGTHRLAFIRNGRKVLVDVSVRPVAVAPPGEAEIRMHLDLPQPGAPTSGALTVAGWALDPQASIGSGLDAVHVWAWRRDVPGAWPQFLGAAALDVWRPDVAAVFGPQFVNAGFHLTSGALEPGLYDVTAFAWNRRTARWEDARTVFVTIR